MTIKGVNGACRMALRSLAVAGLVVQVAHQ